MCPGPRGVSRRALLRTGVTAASLGILGSLAGCRNPLDAGGSTDNLARVDLVPDGATAVAGFDVAAALADDGLRTRANEVLSGVASGRGPGTVEEALDLIADELGLDPRGLGEVLSFGVFEGGSPFGAVLWTEWDRSAVFDAFRARAGSVAETTYSDRTVLIDAAGGEPHTAVGTLDGSAGTFVVGLAPSVRAVIERWGGDGDPVSGDVRDAYTSAGTGYVRFGVDWPAQRIPAESGGPVDPSVLRQLTYAYGSLTEERTLVVTLHAEGNESASDVATFLDAAVSLARKRLENTRTFEHRERVRQVLDSTSVAQQGETIVVRTGNGGESLLFVLGAVVGTFVLGIGEPQSGAQSAPRIAFAFDYDAGSRTLQITHDGGESVSAAALFVRGRGVEPGRWDRLGGSASAESDPPRVVAGDGLTLRDVPADHDVRIVWEPSADASVTLAAHRGPEA